MAFRSIAVPWLGGGLIVLGFAAFNWLRSKRTRRESGAQLPTVARPQPLSASLEHVPDELALDLNSESLPANSNAASRQAAPGALFLGRATAALSPIHFGPGWPEVPR